MRAVITVIGHDTVGIIAGVSDTLSKHSVNILEISQSVLTEFFAMIMLADLSSCDCPLAELSDELEEKGAQMGVKVLLMHEDIFNAMHRV